jgi:hypothetical protein
MIYVHSCVIRIKYYVEILVVLFGVHISYLVIQVLFCPLSYHNPDSVGEPLIILSEWVGVIGFLACGQVWCAGGCGLKTRP